MGSFLARLFDKPYKALCLPFNFIRLPTAAKPLPRTPVNTMDISGHSFSSEAIKIIQHIANSRFIAFDFEFSGVASRRHGGGSGRLNLQEYYGDLRSAAQIYQILQVGLTVVTEDTETGRYVVRPYNFNLNPLPAFKESVFKRTWSYNSGAVAFLMKNGFDINLPLTSGVHYLSRQEEDQVRRKMIEDDEVRSKIPDMVLKDEDTIVVDYIKKSINDWQALSKGKQEAYLNLPSENVKDPIPSVFNRYQIRLTHQIVRSEYPGLKTHGMGHFVQITNPTDKQQANEKELKEQYRERDIANAVGFRWILEAIMGGDITKLPHYYVRSAFDDSDCPKDIDAFLRGLQKKLRGQKRAIVGHNCFTDVINLYKCFFGDLPESVEDFARNLNGLFPLILDTKHLATLGSNRWANTALSSVEEDLANETRPEIYLPDDFSRYGRSSVFHEAGYDSLVTAKIGLKLAAKLMRDGTIPGSVAEKESSEVADQVKAPTTSPDHEDSGIRGLANMAVSAISAGIPAVSSLVTGAQKHKDEAPSEAVEDNDVVVAIKQPKALTLQRKGEVRKIKSASKSFNLFELLTDETEDSTAETDLAEQERREAERVREKVKNGELIPRWEDDGEFWSIVGNKLQTNACQEPFMDLTKGQ